MPPIDTGKTRIIAANGHPAEPEWNDILIRSRRGCRFSEADCEEL